MKIVFTFQQGTEDQLWQIWKLPFVLTFQCLFQLFLQPWCSSYGCYLDNYVKLN